MTHINDEVEPSEDDEEDEMDVEADEEEEEHPAPADSVVVAPTAADQAPSAEETEPFETDEIAKWALEGEGDNRLRLGCLVAAGSGVGLHREFGAKTMEKKYSINRFKSVIV
nr:hypothetical protein [Tanacetum cinerariifolium]